MSNPQVYHYHPETGAFLGATAAKMSPREPDVPRVPRFATLDAPPVAPAGQVARYADGEWSLIADHRGAVVYSTTDGSRVAVDALGPLPDDTTSAPRPSEFHVWDGGAWVPDPAAARDVKRAELRAAAEAAIEAGVVSAALGSDHIYPTTRTDQLNVTGLALAAAIDGPSDSTWEAALWCTPAGQEAWARRAHTAEQVKTVAREVKRHIQAQQDRYEAGLVAVAAAANVTAVMGVTW